MQPMVLEIDGSVGEGGGQMLRSALALSILTQKPVRINNIRANRGNPGLRAQHLACVKAAASICNGQFKGAQIGSSVVDFAPGEVKPGRYVFSVGTAGATALVLHTVYLPLALMGGSESTITITGGTHALAAPCFDYLERTWAGWMKHIGLPVQVKLTRHGFYPRGGGEIVATIPAVKSLNILHAVGDRPITRANAFVGNAGLPEAITKTLGRRLTVKLNAMGLETDLVTHDWKGGPAVVAGVSFPECPVPPLFVGLGEKGKPAERVADDLLKEAEQFHTNGGPVDPHAADQLVLPLAFAPGESQFRTSEVTQHLLTNIEIIRRFVDRVITVEGDLGRPGLVRVSAAVA
jgi:RNA 3'-phosphate cyclase